jgi:hypothetical protein
MITDKPLVVGDVLEFDLELAPQVGDSGFFERVPTEVVIPELGDRGATQSFAPQSDVRSKRQQLRAAQAHRRQLTMKSLIPTIAPSADGKRSKPETCERFVVQFRVRGHLGII